MCQSSVPFEKDFFDQLAAMSTNKVTVHGVCKISSLRAKRSEATQMDAPLKICTVLLHFVRNDDSFFYSFCKITYPLNGYQISPFQLRYRGIILVHGNGNEHEGIIELTSKLKQLELVDINTSV